MMNWITLAEAAGEAPKDESQNNAVLDEAKNNFQLAMEGDLAAIYNLFSPLIWALVIIVATMIIGKIVSGMVRRVSNKAKVDVTLSRFFGKLVYYLILVVGAMLALSKFGIEVTSFAAILAAAGFAIGMALSGTLGNFAAGAMLLIFRPFKVGDVVSAAGITAKVNAIELFTTTFDTGDNRRIIVPNSAIYGGTIENISFHDERRVDIAVGCDYSADLDKTREVLGQAAQSLNDKMLQGDGRGYQIVLGDLGDSCVNWTVRFWCTAADYWGVKEALTRAVKQHLDEAGIGIPFPQMDLHVDKLDG